jgi:hypothetical protein
MTTTQGSGAKTTVDVDGVDADEVASLLEQVAKQIRANTGGSVPADKSTSFKRVDTGQLYDLVHRS